ncbi:olfactory receptor 8S1-like [Hemicordylus capensis]|uniref:olfactory receptor 8S1-like n=1 Tax=Hemicordylus capensis TaxID=884348 RepID=UPI002302EAF7|nr:olfactory receptor 8S1-like [Hemicordylus capensis]
MENQTTVTYFVLLGFSYSPPVQSCLFLVFLFIYVVTLMGNIVIMMVIRGNIHLHSPMYFFLGHLSFLDVCFSSVTVPRVLMNLVTSRTISYSGCMVQTFFIFLTACTEAFLLAAMAYDRYAAICKPLYYGQIMKAAFCRGLVGGAWAVGFIHGLVNTLPVLNLMFCGQNIIRHFSCELPSLLALSCSETFMNRITSFITTSTVAGFTFFIILVSYIHIVSTVLKMQSAEAKRKTFSTCSSHLIVVVLLYSTGCFRYIRPNSASSVIADEFFSVQYSISTPMLNPIIYSLKTREVQEAIKKLMRYTPLVSRVL